MIRNKISLFFLIIFLTSFSFVKAEIDGKNLFYTKKGQFGTCNTCHKNGGSAGRLDPDTFEVNDEIGGKIPSLKNIGEIKDIDEIKNSIENMKKQFNFNLTKDEVEALTKYVQTL